MNNNQGDKRYSRQIKLKGFGEDAQAKLQHAAVLVIGAGGLGCPALQYLAAAGVGTIGIVDFDSIELSNLHRQILFEVKDLGKSKAEIAALKLKARNPEINIITYNLKITNINAAEIISKYDLVIDGSDNYSTRYLINDTCVILNKPLVYGAVAQFEGQVGVFNLQHKITSVKTNYRDLFPTPPNPESALSCEDIGVLGVVPGVIGTMQATEAIKIITGIGRPLCNRILTYNALDNSFFEFTISPTKNSDSNIPNDLMALQSFDYNWFCGIIHSGHEISPGEFEALRKKEMLTIIDVREMDELPIINEFPILQIPLNILQDSISRLSASNKIIVFCNSGSRSLKAIKILNKLRPELNIYNLTGGITAWMDQSPNKIKK